MKFWGSMIAGTLVCSVAFAGGAVPLSNAQSADSVREAPATLPREQPDDPPLPKPEQPTRPADAIPVIVTRGPYRSIQVNVDELGFNILNDAANEPSIAINPTNPDNIVIGWRQFDTIESNFRQAGKGYSFDGGETWTFPGVLQPGTFRSDPVLGADLDGNIYYYSLRGDFFCHMFKSFDGGVTWIGPIAAFGGDKAWMTVDQTDSVGQGNIYVAWSTAGNPFFPNQFTRSVDGGINWPDLVELPPQHPIWGTLTVDLLGNLYISGQSGGTNYVMKSTNAKFVDQTPEFPTIITVDLGGVITIFPAPNPAGLGGQLWIAADNSAGPTSGNVYMLATVNPPGSDPLDVMFSRSEDGGATWSPPLRVNDDPPLTNAYQWFGTMSVAPNGRIDAIWNDTRTNGQANLSELYYAYSFDAGQTWSINIPVSPVFDSHEGWPKQNKLGDYYDMISDEAAANLAYAATFNGEQDVYFIRLGDCNENGVHDGIDLAEGDSLDVNGDGIPDDCQCPGDLNGDGSVDAADLADLLGAWGPCAGCPADFNGDGVINAADLAMLLGAWGPCS